MVLLHREEFSSVCCTLELREKVFSATQRSISEELSSPIMSSELQKASNNSPGLTS